MGLGIYETEFRCGTTEFDSPEVAEYKLGVLQKAFQTVANRGGGSPQMDALSNY